MAALLGIDLVVLLFFKISAGPIVLMLTAAIALSTAIQALREHTDKLTTRPRRTVAFILATTIVPVSLGLVLRPDSESPPGVAPRVQSIADEDIVAATTICDRADCRVERRLRVGAGDSESTVGVIQKYAHDDSGLDYPSGSSVVVLRRDRALAWRSEFLPGYGFLDLGTDTTQNVFILFSVTNHSSVAWVLHVYAHSVDDFGTTDGGLAVDGFTVADYKGIRTLYTARRGWPANLETRALYDLYT